MLHHTIIPWSRMRWLILSLICSSSKRPNPTVDRPRLARRMTATCSSRMCGALAYDAKPLSLRRDLVPTEPGLVARVSRLQESRAAVARQVFVLWYRHCFASQIAAAEAENRN